MSHPVTKCPEAARLQEQWHEATRLLEPTMPEVYRQAEFERQRRSDRWTVAYIAYTTHVQTCPVCQKAIKEDEDGIP